MSSLIQIVIPPGTICGSHGYMDQFHDQRVATFEAEIKESKVLPYGGHIPIHGNFLVFSCFFKDALEGFRRPMGWFVFLFEVIFGGRSSRPRNSAGKEQRVEFGSHTM